MAGYTRQQAYLDGEVIKADHTNLEFDQLVLAMAAGTGHKHDGTASEGAFVPLISDVDNDTRVMVEETPDEDKVQMYAGGVKKVTVDNSGITMSGVATMDYNVTPDTIDVNKNIRVGTDTVHHEGNHNSTGDPHTQYDLSTEVDSKIINATGLVNYDLSTVVDSKITNATGLVNYDLSTEVDSKITNATGLVNYDTSAIVDSKIAAQTLTDHADVDTTGVVDGEAIVYNSTSGNFEPGRAGGPSLGTDHIIRTNATNIEEDITITVGTNGMSVGPITINSGFSVTVNGTWTIV